MIFFSFCIFGKGFISTFLSVNIFFKYKIPKWQFYLQIFVPLSSSFPSFKQNIYYCYFCFSANSMSFFLFLVTFKITYPSLKTILYVMSLCSFLCVLCSWILWNILDLCVYSFHQIWKHFSSCFSCLLLPLGLQLHVYYVSLSCPRVHWCSFYFFSSLYSLCVSFWINAIAMSSNLLTFSSVMSFLLLTPFSVFFISETQVFISRSLIWVFFMSLMFLSCLFLF